MDLTFILSAIIFTLLAIVVATSLLNNRSSSANALLGSRAGGSGLEVSRQNGHVAEARKTICASSPRRKKKAADDDWCEISGSTHDHWDVVKSVLSDEAQPCIPIEEEAAPAEHSSSTSTSLEAEPPSEVTSERVRTSFIGLSEKELLKFAFSHPQTEGATESPGINDKVDSTENNSLKYVPGKARSHHLEMMMSSEELEEEKRVQREQLAAIFQLLKENKETFGDVSEGDMEEQLKLYSI